MGTCAHRYYNTYSHQGQATEYTSMPHERSVICPAASAILPLRGLSQNPNFGAHTQQSYFAIHVMKV